MIIKRFTESAIEEAGSFEITGESFSDRPLVEGITIDGQTSMDLDDGINLTKRGKNYLLQVSIADVASAIKPGSELFSAVMDRVETRYLIEKNIPMLPRILSEYKLSLMQDAKRPAITFEMEILPNLEIENFKISETIFYNRRKLYYGLFDLIERGKGDDPDYHLFKEMAALAMALFEKRRSKGALAIYDLKKGIYTNEEGTILPLRKEMSHIANIVVQEFMILTNKTLGAYFAKNDFPILFRNHTVRQSCPDRNEILEQINTAILNPQHLDSLRSRSSLWFNRAQYSPILQGHFGLNEPVYTHVTSPIRRAADLINHHLIKAHINGTEIPFDFNRLIEISNDINKLIFAIKDEKASIFKERANNQANMKLSYYSDAELAEMEIGEFTQIVNAAVKNKILFESLAQALSIRFTSGKIDLNIIYLILFQSSIDQSGWYEYKKLSLQFLYRHKGMPVQLLNILDQKGNIDKFETIFKDSKDGFRAKIVGTINGKEIIADKFSHNSTKRNAVHFAAYHLLELIVDLPANQESNIMQLPDSKQNDSDDIIDKPNESDESTANIEDDIDIPSDSKGKLTVFSTDEKIVNNPQQNKTAKSSIQSIPQKIKSVTAIEENYVGTLLEMCSKHKDWPTPEYSFSETGPSHCPVITCFAKLITPKLIYYEQAEADTKKLAKQLASQLILNKMKELKESIPNSLNDIQNTVKEINSSVKIGENYVGMLVEICNKNKGWRSPEYSFTEEGELHAPIITCHAILKTRELIIEEHASSTTKQIAKQEVAKKIIEKINENTDLLSSKQIDLHAIENVNYVGRLQEIYVKFNLPLPDYQFVQFGTPDDTTYECILTVMIDGENLKFVSYGQTKKDAKQNAAQNCLKILNL